MVSFKDDDSHKKKKYAKKVLQIFIRWELLLLRDKGACIASYSEIKSRNCLRRKIHRLLHVLIRSCIDLAVTEKPGVVEFTKHKHSGKEVEWKWRRDVFVEKQSKKRRRWLERGEKVGQSQRPISYLEVDSFEIADSLYEKHIQHPLSFHILSSTFLTNYVK